jgi:FixJ family two-component response regulator
MDSGNVIVVVDDDPLVRSSLSRLLLSAGYRVRTYASARDLLDAGGAGDAACLVLDIHLGGMSGFGLEDALRERGSVVPVVFITAHDDAATRTRAEQTRPGAYLRKPFDADDLFNALEEAIASV